MMVHPNEEGGRQMKKNDFEQLLLGVLLLLPIMILPVLLRKPPIKDWLLAFLFNAYTNVIVDRFIVRNNLLEYPVRFLPKIFKVNLLFDHLLYPTFSIFINQVTKNDKPFTVFYKIFLFVLPVFFIEFWAARKTNLINWKRGWKWYYSFLSMVFKSLLNRGVLGVVKSIDEKEMI
jgi:hypothetical protein